MDIPAGVFIFAGIKLLIGTFMLITGNRSKEEPWAHCRASAISFYKVMGILIGILLVLLLIIMIGAAISDSN